MIKAIDGWAKEMKETTRQLEDLTSWRVVLRPSKVTALGESKSGICAHVQDCRRSENTGRLLWPKEKGGDKRPMSCSGFFAVCPEVSGSFLVARNIMIPGKG